MTIDANPFRSATINMVSILAENRHAKKGASSSQLKQYSKQVWRPKLVVAKENTTTLSHDVSRKNERKEWRPRVEKRVETRGQSKPP